MVGIHKPLKPMTECTGGRTVILVAFQIHRISRERINIPNENYSNDKRGEFLEEGCFVLETVRMRC